MTTSPRPDIELGSVEPAPSLSTTLDALGHDCPGDCARAVDELGAHLWFVRRAMAGPGRGPASLVVVDASDYPGPRERSRQLMRSINDCLRPDGIRMSERRIDDCGVALAVARPMPHESLPTTALRLVRSTS
jgi:hypothetical protein